jgi:Zyg-11 family protein
MYFYYISQLMSLDISGTNLAGRGAFEADCRNPDAVVGLCDIPGLVSRVDRPLDFLGLYR